MDERVEGRGEDRLHVSYARTCAGEWTGGLIVWNVYCWRLWRDWFTRRAVQQQQTHRLLNSRPDEPVQWSGHRLIRTAASVCVCVCVSTAQDGLGEKVPRLRPLNFTSGCCLAGSFDQMWKLRSRWRWQRPNCYGFPRSCTWICNPRVEQLSPSSSWVPAPCIITLTTSCDHPLPLHTIVQYSYLSLITYIVGSLECVVTMKTVLLSVLLIFVWYYFMLRIVLCSLHKCSYYCIFYIIIMQTIDTVFFSSTIIMGFPVRVHIIQQFHSILTINKRFCFWSSAYCRFITRTNRPTSKLINIWNQKTH